MIIQSTAVHTLSSAVVVVASVPAVVNTRFKYFSVSTSLLLCTSSCSSSRGTCSWPLCWLCPCSRNLRVLLAELGAVRCWNLVDFLRAATYISSNRISLVFAVTSENEMDYSALPIQLLRSHLSITCSCQPSTASWHPRCRSQCRARMLVSRAALDRY